MADRKTSAPAAGFRQRSPCAESRGVTAYKETARPRKAASRKRQQGVARGDRPKRSAARKRRRSAAQGDRTTEKRKDRNKKTPSFRSWSKCGDSNSAPHGPKERYTDFLHDLTGFFGLFSPKSVLSDALCHTASKQSESVDGQRCGRNNVLQ